MFVQPPVQRLVYYDYWFSVDLAVDMYLLPDLLVQQTTYSYRLITIVTSHMESLRSRSSHEHALRYRVTSGKLQLHCKRCAAVLGRH